ncbi:hypothetical protein P153DRAFT_391097 [Dothidotthia symphoricarpi CBS 119687]|uniref:Methyltransferase type 11 domain-containing protein n=1 Tax=Dothidotthia symphoricarpi CBS 119687 TaxID=1392245 RepID=A0A6A6A0F8_9PLEO|nr:uncharacterized protein P153DRAFT_391097 [Dothidotthia symphoricarpi CBS 119687]KAF2124061.1 hypothetical protein P153DRAFT_391097 [Dothidotthia symphoricarpi CBS 119687]
MFPTFEIPAQHAETVGARKHRKAKEEESARRNSSSTTQSSGSSNSVRGSERQPSTSSSASSAKPAGRSGFGWFSKRENKGVQEISGPTTLKKSPPPSLAVAEQPSNARSQSPPATLARTTSRDVPAPNKTTSQNVPPETNSVHQQRFPPPLRSLPSLPFPLPPSGTPQLLSPMVSPGLSPGPPSLGSRGRIDDRTRSQHSNFTHSSYSPSTSTSYSPSTTSSDRTTFSNKSVFSNAGRYDDVISEQGSWHDKPSPPARSVSPGAPRPPPARPNANAHADPRYSSNVMLEPVERESRSRSGSSMAERGAKPPQGPFARALAKMESAGPRIISARLNEEWEGLDDDDESHQEIAFEKRLWALTAYQRLTQNKHLQSPAHEILSGSRLADQRRILHLHGSLADGWMLATRYPAATVYTMSSMKTLNPPTSYPAPLNHHSLYVPSISSTMPFPDGYFDAIVSRSVSTFLRNNEWAQSFFDCMRVLKPGGQIEILSVDPHMSCERQKLSSWVDEHITCRLEAHGMSMQPSDTVLDTMEIVGLENIRRARVALPAHTGSPKALSNPAAFAGSPPSSSPQDMLEASRMMANLGRHFYQDLYGKLVRDSHGEEWFWAHKDIKEECERYQTKMVLTIACAQKPTAPAPGENYI